MNMNPNSFSWAPAKLRCKVPNYLCMFDGCPRSSSHKDFCQLNCKNYNNFFKIYFGVMQIYKIYEVETDSINAMFEFFRHALQLLFVSAVMFIRCAFQSWRFVWQAGRRLPGPKWTNSKDPLLQTLVYVMFVCVCVCANNFYHFGNGSMRRCTEINFVTPAFVLYTKFSVSRFFCNLI